MIVAEEIVLTALCELQSKDQNRAVFSWLEILEHCMEVTPYLTKLNFVNMFNVLHTAQSGITPFIKRSNKDEIDFFAINSDIDDSLLIKIKSVKIKDRFKKAVAIRQKAEGKMTQLTQNTILDLTANHADPNAELSDFDTLFPSFSVVRSQHNNVVVAIEKRSPNTPALTAKDAGLYKNLTIEVVFDAIANHILTNKLNLFDYKTIVRSLMSQYTVKKTDAGIFLNIIRARICELENLTYVCKYIPFIRHIGNSGLAAQFYIPTARESMVSSAPSLLKKYCELTKQILIFQKNTICNISLAENGKLKSLAQGMEKRKPPAIDIRTLRLSAINFLRTDTKKRNAIILNVFLNLYEQFGITSFSLNQLMAGINPAFTALHITKDFQLYEVNVSDFESLYAGIVAKICEFAYFAKNFNYAELHVQLTREKMFNKEDFQFDNKIQLDRIINLFKTCVNKTRFTEQIDLALSLVIKRCIERNSKLIFTEEYFNLTHTYANFQKETSLDILNALLRQDFFRSITSELLELKITNEFFNYVRSINPKLIPSVRELYQSSLNDSDKPIFTPNNSTPMEIEVVDAPSNNVLKNLPTESLIDIFSKNNNFGHK